MALMPLAPPSVQLVPAKEYNGAPIGTSYDVRVYIGKLLLYVLVYIPSPFTGFESFPESVETNLSKSPRNPQVICPATWSLFTPGGH